MSKYKNKKIMVDGIEFDSKKEAEYWLVLRHREKFGEIENLRRQERYLLNLNRKENVRHIMSQILLITTVGRTRKL